ncbi:MAG TPA: aldolase/citrate lyase family protein [Actinomycetes bacterium]|nr:aldolase/citrate lyase family protein [Actinomycetes bacterium]
MSEGARELDTFLDALATTVDEQLAEADRVLAMDYPGDPGTRQPVHTVYVPADLADESTPAQWGTEARTLLDGFCTQETVDEEVHARVDEKLSEQPIEDLRIDFEDGYGNRPDEEEDATARTAGALLTKLLAESHGPFIGGIRFKSLELATRRRGVRTLTLLVDSVLDAGPPPDGFLVTLPKVTSVDQVEAMVELCARLEERHGLPAGQLRFEIQIETPQAILGAVGRAPVAPMVHTAGSRCVGLHYGTYDYSAACGVSAAYQSMEHPVADHAKAVMQVAAAGTGVRLSDGSTNVLPVGDNDQVLAAMRLHARLVRRSLERGYYQGWDMHPGHLATRYLATYAFYREGLPAAATRLRNYLSRSAAGVMDEPATAQALAAFVTRGLHCGALDETEVVEATGVGRQALDALARRLPNQDIS